MTDQAAVHASADIALVNVAIELGHAIDRFGPMASPHEGYAVVLEELDELWAEVKDDKSSDHRARMRAEAIQVAAMAVRFIVDCCEEAS
jgi:hypothetical protein